MRGTWTIASALLACLPATAWAAPGDVVRSFSSPVDPPHHATYPLDIAWAGGELFIANIVHGSDPLSPATVFVVDPADGAFIRRLDYEATTGGQTLKQVAFDGAALFLIGPPRVDGVTLVRSQTRYRIDVATGGVTETYSTASTSRGVAWDPGCGQMWDLAGMGGDAHDVSTDEVHLRQLPGGESSYVINTGTVHDDWFALAYDGCSLWTVDFPAVQLVRFAIDDGAELERLAAPAPRSIGLSFDGDNLLVSSNETDTIYVVEIGPTGSCTPRRTGLECLAPGQPTVGMDAGSGPVEDAGTSRPDAGGSPPRDAGAAADAGAVSRADGGCDCGVAGNAGSPIGLLLLVGWLVLRRRR